MTVVLARASEPTERSGSNCGGSVSVRVRERKKRPEQVSLPSQRSETCESFTLTNQVQATESSRLRS